LRARTVTLPSAVSCGVSLTARQPLRQAPPTAWQPVPASALEFESPVDLGLISRFAAVGGLRCGRSNASETAAAIKELRCMFNYQ
jgi:hypothetical protein